MNDDAQWVHLSGCPGAENSKFANEAASSHRKFVKEQKGLDIAAMTVRLLVTYMEQFAPPACNPVQQPIAEVSITREFPEVPAYLQLYRSVGAPLQWDEHTRLSHEELSTFLRKASTIVYVLRKSGVALGLCEFSGFGEDDVELKHFGLIPEAQGQRLGPYLLDWSLRSVWDQGAARVWLRTDTNDHIRAKPTYLRSGFRAYAEVWEDFPD